MSLQPVKNYFELEVKAAKKLVPVKKELRDIARHFKKDGWDLSYSLQECLLKEAGVEPLAIALLLVKSGYRVVFSTKRGELVVRK